jgi:hypothetical protein
MNENLIYISNKRLACDGALIATSAVFIYSLIVLIYVLIRSSSTIYGIIPFGYRLSILFENSIAGAHSIATFSILMAIISSVVGAFTAIILKKSLFYFNPNITHKKVVLISGITPVLVLSIIFFLLRILLKDWMTFNNVEPFLFWFLFPAAVFFGACISLGTYLNGLLKLQKKVKIILP